MQAVAELPRDAGWLYEIKWDGYRAIGREMAGGTHSSAGSISL
jgi:ATP-dependent DNA ligase